MGVCNLFFIFLKFIVRRSEIIKYCAIISKLKKRIDILNNENSYLDRQLKEANNEIRFLKGNCAWKSKHDTLSVVSSAGSFDDFITLHEVGDLRKQHVRWEDLENEHSHLEKVPHNVPDESPRVFSWTRAYSYDAKRNKETQNEELAEIQGKL